MRNLPADSALVRTELGDLWDWNHMAANLAELVDLMSYWLQSEYARWTYDPDDPDNKRAERERKRAGIKPPPIPLVRPVAHRPPSVAGSYQHAYEQLVDQLGAGLSADGEPAGTRWVSSDEFDRALGL